MQTISEFFSMGGYGAFIWTAYGTTTFVLVVFLILSLQKLNKASAAFTKLKNNALQPRHGNSTRKENAN
jgi:heme exporter protein D